jgi:hypothetical protein
MHLYVSLCLCLLSDDEYACMLWMIQIYNDVDAEADPSDSGFAGPAAVLLLRRLRFGKGVVGSLGGTLTVSLSPSSVSFVTRKPANQQPLFLYS